MSGYIPECSRPHALPPRFWAVDTETTGVDWNTTHVCSIGVVQFNAGRVSHEDYTLVNPGVPIPKEATDVHGITDADVKDAPTFEEAFGQMGLPEVLKPGHIVVGHNVWFDLRHFARLYPIACTVYDTMIISRTILDLRGHTLDAVCEKLGVKLTGHHNAKDDAIAAGKAFLKLIDHPDEVAEKETRLGDLQTGLLKLAEFGTPYEKDKASSLLKSFPRWSDKQESFARGLIERSHVPRR